MSVSVFEPNTTQVPNFIFEMIPRLSEAELKVLMVIIRKTYGWHKESDKISSGQLELLTGLSYSAIKKARSSLSAKGVKLIKYKGNGRAITEYCRPYPVPVEEPVESAGSPWGPPGGPGEDLQGGHKEALTKDTPNKRHLEQKRAEERKQGTAPPLPEFPFPEFIKEYQNQRLKAFRTLPRIPLKELDQARETLTDYGITDEQAVEYAKALGAKWRSEDVKFWPVSLLKFDGALLARLDKGRVVEEMEDADLMSEMKRLFPGWVPKSERTA